MERFLESLSVEQLTLLSNMANEQIRKKRQGKNIRIANLEDITDDYNDIRDDIIDTMGNIRSLRIHVNTERREALLKFETPELATAARHLLSRRYKDVTIY